ncbi:MAG: bifunctional 4-hydroxy-2-oxoglutarate aldolase/2-dehydro-3-deoxy-phosphogluconate aldolase, partial [Ekhidna sp.]
MESPMIPVFNHTDKDVAVEVVKACYQGGARLFEFTNRSEEAIDVFKHILNKQSEYPDMIIGIGSILNVDQCKVYIDAGAAFIVSPIVDKEVADLCKQHQIAWVPGCGTLT